MNDNFQPVSDEHLEARITAYILGEASAFEAAEIEALIEKSPELKLFANRLRTLDGLIKEAETTANTPDADWKLPAKKRAALNPAIGPIHVLVPEKESRIRRASFRTAWGIAAILILTFFTKRFLIIPASVQKETSFTVSYSAATPEELQVAVPAASEMAASQSEDVVHIGGRVRTPGPQKFKEGLTLADAVESAGGATEFGSSKRVQLYRDGKTQTYDLTDERLAKIELQPNDTIEMPQKNWFGCGAGRDEILAEQDHAAPPKDEGIEIAGNDRARPRVIPPAPAELPAEMEKVIAAKADSLAQIPVPDIAAVAPSTDFGDSEGFGDGLADKAARRGEKPVSRNSIDAILNNPDRTAAAGKPKHAPAASEPIAEAERFRQSGKFEEARETLNRAAQAEGADEAKFKEEIAALDDPIRTSPALTQEGASKVDDVRRNLYMAEGNLQLGKYDEAKKSYEDTLRIDPYNAAARRGMEKIQSAKSDYYRAAYDHTRSELLMEVDKAWELAVPADLAEGKKGEANEQVDLYADSNAPAEAAKLTGWFSDGNSSQGTEAWDGVVIEGSTFASRAGSVKSDLSVIRKFEYPSEYEAPEVGNLAMEGTSHSGPVFPVTPATPTDFDGSIYYGSRFAGDPKQIDITTKHVEITQANDEELGFDWILKDENQKADLSIFREFQHLSEYEPPELPNQADADTPFPVTPATPTDFDSTAANEELAPLLGDIPLVGRLFEKEQPSLADLSQEIPAAQEPFSTFSLNISDASFQLAAAAVEKGERPDPESIKPEQFYNAVDYGDPAPSSLEPVAAAIDQTAHPVIPGRNLVRVAIRTASTGRSAAQPLRLTLLVDQSGSMARADRRAAMDTALAQLATLLTENDRVTVIGFSRTPRLIADALPGNDAGKLPDLINPTASEGGTNLEQALNLSSELALRHKLDGAQNRIVLFTDGAANLGDADPERLAERVKELRQQGLAFDIAGIGTNDTNDRLLSELARHGNGRYYLVGENTANNLAAQLAGAFRPAAENVKVQVKLNPERVGNYKLIGFEKDRLKTEDFHDDSVDAAELAADEAGVAIYQVETLPEGTGEIGEVSVRFRDTASGEMVERAWTIPHDPTTPAFDKADPKTQLATLALLAAQKLQGGPLADAIRFPDHTETIAKLKQAYAGDAKTQRLFTLINALR